MRHFFLTMMMLLTPVMVIVAGDVVTICYADGGVKVKNRLKGVTVTTDGSRVTVDNKLTDREVLFVLSGQSADGCLTYHGSHKATFRLAGLNLSTDNGAVLDFQSGKRMKVEVAKGTRNNLVDGADSLHKACIQTNGHMRLEGKGVLCITARAKHAIRSKENLEVDMNGGTLNINSDTANGLSTDSILTIKGGTLNITLNGVDRKGLKSSGDMLLSNAVLNVMMTGNGGKGIKAGGNLDIVDAEVNVQTTGNYISESDPFEGFGNGMPPMWDGNDESRPQPEGMPRMGGMPDPWGMMPDSVMQQHMEEGRRMMVERFGEAWEDSLRAGFGFMGMQGWGGEQLPDEIGERGNTEQTWDPTMLGGMPGRHSYEGTAKAVKVVGIATIHSGKVNLSTTSGGAEGLEGKQGVRIKGGSVSIKTQDDAINSGGRIEFLGGNILAWSVGNDAIDSNCRDEGAITIQGGNVTACSQCGPPDEAYDCDFSPMVLTGGTVFGMGGSMGGQPTTPMESADTQPTVVLAGLPLPEGKTLVCTDMKGHEVFQFVIPFSMRQSSSILSCPQFQIGQTYQVRLKETNTLLKEFTFDSCVSR